ncbi:MAG TPA: YhdT family protein [Pirellulaceae bacterium]|nr:YhdT family protein [Pirellulaceae bacterium]
MNGRLEDPVLRSSRREGLLVLGIWAVACVYTVGTCYVFGYNRDPDSIKYVAGFPDWVFYGIIVPWTVCTLLCYWLANFFIRDEDLGEEQAESDLGSLEDALGGEGEHV